MQRESNNYQLKIARIIALIKQSSLSTNTTTSTSSMIIDSIFPYREAYSADITNTIFGRLFGIPFKISDKNVLYKDLPTIKCYVYTLYQLAITILSFLIKMTYLITY